MMTITGGSRKDPRLVRPVQKQDLDRKQQRYRRPCKLKKWTKKCQTKKRCWNYSLLKAHSAKLSLLLLQLMMTAMII